jgi:hypothetical protein
MVYGGAAAYWVPGSRLRQGFAGPRTHSAAEALAKAASRETTTWGVVPAYFFFTSFTAENSIPSDRSLV